MLKADLRKLYKQKRLDLTYSEKEKLSDLLLINFQKLGIKIPKTVMSYVPIEKLCEFDPWPIVHYCSFLNPELTVSFPVINHPDVIMKAVAVENLVNTEFKINELGFAQPINAVEIDTNSIDLVIVPLLAFDNKGNRIGYGKGYYDRFLKDCRKDTVKIGCSFFDAVPEIDNVNEHDIALNYCITPQTVYQFL